MASNNDGVRHGSVALNVSHLDDKSATRRRRPAIYQKTCCGYSSVALTAVGISLIVLGVLDVVFGTLCAAAGVRYGPTGDTLIKPWRAIPLGGIALTCGALGVHLTRRLEWKPRRQAIVTMLLSAVCSAWAAVVVSSFSFDVAEQSTAYQALKKELKEALASQNVLLGFRKNKIDLAQRDLAYFSGAVTFATLTAIIAGAQAVMAGFYISDPGIARESERERITRTSISGSTRNTVTSVKVFINYKNKAALAAGVIQIVCGCSVVLGLGLALATEHNPAWASYVIIHGIIFVTSGIAGVISSKSKTKRFVTASMIMSLCAGVAAVNMICSDVAFIINSNLNPTSGRSKIDKLSLTTKLFAIHGLDLFVNLIELVTACVLSGLGCHMTCDLAGKADDTRCLVSYVEIGQTERSGETDFTAENTTDGGFSLQLPDILHSSTATDDDIFGHERPQYMTEALASNS